MSYTRAATVGLSAAIVLALAGSALAQPVTWTGGGDNATWFDGRNWNNPAFGFIPTVPPQPGQDAVVPVSANIFVNGSILGLNSLSVNPGATVSITVPNTNTFSVLGNVTNARVFTTGSFQVGGTFSGGRLTFTNGSLSNDLRLLNADLVIQTSRTASFIASGNVRLTGNLSLTQRLNFQASADAPASTLSVDPAFTNNGILNLSSSTGGGSVQILVGASTANTLTNNGSFTIAFGSGLTSATITGGLTNPGTFSVSAPTTFSASTLSNSGVLSLAAPLNLPQGAAFNQSAGSIEGAGFFSANGINASITGGAINGGEARFRNSAITLNGAGSGSFRVIGNSSLNGPIGDNQAVTLVGDTNAVSNLTLLAPSTGVSGSLVLASDVSGFGARLTGNPLTVNANGVLYLAPGLGQHTLDVASITNNGVFTIDALARVTRGTIANNGAFATPGQLTLQPNAGQSVALTQNAGSLDASGALVGAGISFNFNAGQIFGQPVLINSSAAFAPAATAPVSLDLRGSSSFSGSLASGQNLLINATSSEGAATLALTSNVNAQGNITLSSTGSASATLNGPGATLTIQPTGSLTTSTGLGGQRSVRLGTLINNGSVAFNAPTTGLISTLTNNASIVANAQCNFAGGPQTWTHANGMFNSGSQLLFADNVRFTWTGGDVSGTHGFGNATLVLNRTALATFYLRGASALQGSLATNQLVQIAGDAQGDASLTVADGFVNNGTIVGTSSVGNRNAGIVLQGSFSNTLTGAVLFYVGSGGTRSITGGSIANAGSFQFNAPATLTNTILSNNNNIGVSAALTLGQNAEFRQNAGQVNSAALITANPGTFAFNAGALLGGTPLITNGGLSIGPSGTENPLTFELRGNARFSGQVNPGQTIRIIANPSAGNANVDIANALTNRGVIDFAPASNASFARATASGPVTNNGRINLPGRSAFQVNNSFTQPAGATLNVGFGQFGSGNFGQLAATGALTINGAFTANIDPNFNPSCNNSFPFLQGASRTGTFASATTPPSINGFKSLLSYSPSGAAIIIPSQADIADTGGNPGADGTLDNGDFQLFVTSFFTGCSAVGTPCGPADITDTGAATGPDGRIDNGDFQLFIARFFGSPC
jgi:hypothetical protein